MNRKSALSILLLLVVVIVSSFVILLAGCAGQPQPAPEPTNTPYVFPAPASEVVKFCTDWSGQVLGLYEVKDREKYYVRPIDFPFTMEDRVSSQIRHWRPCPGVKVEMQASWNGPDSPFTTSDADRFIAPGRYFEIKLVEVP